MDKLPIVEILKVGLSGLVFLLAYLGYRLLSKEQDNKNPNPLMLKYVYRYILICVGLALIVGGFDLVELFSSSADENEIQQLKHKKDITDKNSTIEDLNKDKNELLAIISDLENDKLTVEQKIDLGLYYAQPVGEDMVEKRNSKKAAEYLFFALREHDEKLNEPRKAEIVIGLVRIREKITIKDDYEFLLQKIEEYRYGIEMELDLAKVYWAYANSVRQNRIQKRQESLRHFLIAAHSFEENISDNDINDIETLISILVQSNDQYLNEYGSQIMKSLKRNNKEEIQGYLDDWVSRIGI